MTYPSRTGKRSVRIRRSTSSPSCSAKSVAESDDLLIHILSLLPIKALLRCKCVCKRWLSLITNPTFSYLIIKSKPPTVSGFFLCSKFHSFTTMEYEFLSLDDIDDGVENSVRRPSVAPPFKSQLRFADHPSDMVILQSCNGLMLCQCSCPNHYNRNYFIYNPTTKQNTFLPPINGVSNHVLGISLAFDPSKSPYYKVVLIRKCHLSSDLRQIEVYSSNAGPWRVSGSPFTLPSTVEFGNTVFWNNTVYWFGSWGDGISFDIEREKINVLSFPHHDLEDEQVTRAFRFMDESLGHLYVVEVNDQSSSQFLVYEMEKDGLGWSPKYNVDLEPLAAAFPEMIETEYYNDGSIFDFSIICIIREEKEESYIVLQIPNNVIRYNLKDRTFKKLRDLRLSGEYRSFQFVESLACV